MTTTLYEQLLERSHVEDIPYASGFLVCGLMARTKEDAAQLRARHAEMHAQNAHARGADIEHEADRTALLEALKLWKAGELVVRDGRIVEVDGTETGGA